VAAAVLAHLTIKSVEVAAAQVDTGLMQRFPFRLVLVTR
jgi:hypothetical protein